MLDNFLSTLFGYFKFIYFLPFCSFFLIFFLNLLPISFYVFPLFTFYFFLSAFCERRKDLNFFYPFKAPAIKAFKINFCKNRTNKIAGRSAKTLAAAT